MQFIFMFFLYILPLQQKENSNTFQSKNKTVSLLKYLKCSHIQIRKVIKVTASELWKSVTGVSPAGKKRGRGKGKNRKIIRDLNRGQFIGLGRKNMLWPGLNTPVAEKNNNQQILKIKELPPDPDREKRIYELRDKIFKFRRMKLTSLERGWSGGIMGGRSIGPPDAAKALISKAIILKENNKGNQYDSNELEDSIKNFEKREFNSSISLREYEWDQDLKGKVFDSKILKLRIICHMTGDEGRKRAFSCIVVTGNKNGLIGFAYSKAGEAKIALRHAKNKAFKHLVNVERHEDRTIFHTLYGEHKKTKLYLFRASPGNGIVAHRAVKTIAELAGIKDLYAKVEGSTKNYHNITRCMFDILAKQETYQQLADRTGFNVVEFSPEREYLPVVLAVPSPSALANLPQSALQQEPPNFEDIYTGGRLFKHRRKSDLFFRDFPTYQNYLKKMDRIRNMVNVKLKMLAEIDITGQYPYPQTAADVIDRKKASTNAAAEDN